MRVGFNGRYLQKTLSGIEYYLFNLIKALAEIDGVNEYYLFLNQLPFANDEVKLFLEKSAVRTRSSKWPSKSRISRLTWDYLALKKELKEEKIDIFHGPSFSIPLSKACASVVTIHDLAWLYFPKSYTRLNRYYFKVLLPLVVKRADLIITDSQSSKRDIVNLLSVPEKKTVVVYPGVSPVFKVLNDAPRLLGVRQKYGISGDFLLNVSGLITPRKNLVALIKAYDLLRRTKKIGHQLVIVGTPAWSSSPVFEIVANLGLESDVIFTGSVPTDDLVSLYNAADLNVFPSLYEGFGFPVLESMACGTPTVSANVSSIPEIAGDAGLLAEANNKEGLAAAIDGLIDNQALKERLSSKGLSRVKLFNWETTAKQTLKVYERVVGGG